MVERGGFEPPVPRGFYGLNSARVWRTIGPTKSIRAEENLFRSGFGSGSALFGSLRSLG
jgi:hypothetical protein